jgi:hypothetical protein
MADSYLSIAAIATDEFMTERMYACVSQQQHLGNITINLPNVSSPFNAQEWVNMNRYVWASSPSWGEKWSSALASGNENPGKDEAVITDVDILSTVQALLEPQ